MGKASARWSALVLAAGMLLAGCSDGDNKNPVARPPVNCQDPFQAALCGPGSGMTPVGPPTDGPAAATMPPGCNEPTVSPQMWYVVCGQTGPAPGENPPTPQEPRPLGEAALTTGDPYKGGTVEITPTTAVYITRNSRDSEPSRDLLLVITVKERNTGAVPTNSVNTGVWTYLAPDGEAITRGYMALGGSYGSLGETVQPGTFHWGENAWAIRTDQRGGVMQYVDGTGVTHQWQLPAQDTGPQVAEVKKILGR